MFLDHVFQNVPNFCLKSLHHLLRVFNIVRCTIRNKLFHYKRFEQLDCHLFRKTALIDLQLRPYDDNGSPGVIDTFSEQILTESSGLSL